MAKAKRRQRMTRPAVIVNGQILNAGQEMVWRLANEDIGSGELARMKRGLSALRLLEHDFDAQASATALSRGLAESVALERSRGEKVEIGKQPEMQGRIRIRTRDGLETLARSGAINRSQHKAGLLYRDLYEATDPERDLRSHLETLDRPGRSGEAAAEAWAERRMRLARSIAAIEAKVRLADRNDRAVRVLREVAGHARCVGVIAAGGGSQAVCKKALITALDVCAAHFGVT